jgi:hypothetical protein
MISVAIIVDISAGVLHTPASNSDANNGTPCYGIAAAMPSHTAIVIARGYRRGQGNPAPIPMHHVEQRCEHGGPTQINTDPGSSSALVRAHII